MSSFLWKFFLEDDVDRFRQVLSEASCAPGPQAQKIGHKGATIPIGSGPSATSHLETAVGSSKPSSNSRRSSGWVGPQNASLRDKAQWNWSTLVLTRADVNLRDRNGLTILHHAASSNAANAVAYAGALIDHPLIDLYRQDLENGWTALHRALYFGNITTARAILAKDRADVWAQGPAGGTAQNGGLIRTKDKEGNSPFDVLNSTITHRRLHRVSSCNDEDRPVSDSDEVNSTSSAVPTRNEDGSSIKVNSATNIEGDEVFTFGSNKNLNLGFGDEDDRHYPERVTLHRPDHLVRRFHYESMQKEVKSKPVANQDSNDEPMVSSRSTSISALPSVIKFRPITIQDVKMSKLHTAILTNDPESNLYICGFGSGGRLGTGDETTRFTFVCIDGGPLRGQRIIDVGLGQNHTLAVTNAGDLLTWGINTFGQLGYTLPRSSLLDEEPKQLTPRQVFGPLKRDFIAGAAASSIHSAVYNANALYTFGKNEGQLGLVDSDARSLAVQITPRRVGASLFSSPIKMVSAIDRATVCLLENHDVWVFANFGYAKLTFPFEQFANYFLKASAFGFRYNDAINHIIKIAAGGDTICALTRGGDVFTMNVSQRLEPGPATASTTNPSKIRNALSSPYRMWSSKKSHMAVRDVDIGQDGSITICTSSGSVWRRVKRTKANERSLGLSAVPRGRVYKFSRIPGLTRVEAVRSNAFGAFAAVRKDFDTTRTQIHIVEPNLLAHMAPLLPFHELDYESDESEEDDTPRFWKPGIPRDHFNAIKRSIMKSKDCDSMIAAHLSSHPFDESTYDAEIRTTKSETSIPIHRFLLSSRSTVLRKLMSTSKTRNIRSKHALDDVLIIEIGGNGKTHIQLNGMDFLTLLNLVYFVYLDDVIDVWHYTRHQPKSSARYRLVRTELMKLAAKLELQELEVAVRAMRTPNPSMQLDMESAIVDPQFFEDTDTVVELSGSEVTLHSALARQRCPFFEGLFNGRAGGRWLSSRRGSRDGTTQAVRIDLKHVRPTTFKLVLRYLYCDTGEEIFDDVVTTNLDDFLDLVIDVSSIADELLLDRLSQVCQRKLGRFVTMRNASQLLNSIARFSVTEFKRTTLEYLCLNLEGVLEADLLYELDDDIMVEFDTAVRENQLACLPFAKSGRAEMLLREKFPSLAEAQDRERQAKIYSVNMLKTTNEYDSKISTSFKTKELEDGRSSLPPSERKDSPLADTNVKGLATSFRPKWESSTPDLLFDMDNDDAIVTHHQLDPSSPEPVLRLGDTVTTKESLHHLSQNARSPSQLKATKSVSSSPRLGSHLPGSGEPTEKALHAQNAAWSSASLPPKLSIKDIMAQTTPARASNLSIELSHQAKGKDREKLSQRQRKRRHQEQQAQQHTPSPTATLTASGTPPDAPHMPSCPWKIAPMGPKVTLKDLFADPPATGHSLSPSSPEPTGRSQFSREATVTYRPDNDPHSSFEDSATLAGVCTAPNLIHHSPRSIVHGHNTEARESTARPENRANFPQPQRFRYIPVDVEASEASPPEPALRLSIADIISQQQAEQDVIRQAVAKRSLHEIQQEQEFMEWWDAESKKVQDEGLQGEKRQNRPSRGGKRGKGRATARRGSRGEGSGEAGGKTDAKAGKGERNGPGGGRDRSGARRRSGGVKSG
ncbi:MAG: hypothetical protein M1833_003065 [Piccolia ochrophora]|nr:MAG: hypothetical protein M1833_003065 [Piccolia ochrophora]